MALFQMKWLRALVRRNTNPIEYRHALAWKDRLSIAYMLVAWNAFGVVCYMVYSGRNDWAKFHGLKSDEEGRMTSCGFRYIIPTISNIIVLFLLLQHNNGRVR